MQKIEDNRTDEKLVDLSLGDKQNFIFLINRYEKPLGIFIRRISGFNKEDVEDLLQEIFIKIYCNLNNFDSKLKFSSWAYRIARNQTISEFRKRKVRPVDYFEEKDLVRLVDNFELQEISDVDTQFLQADIEKVFKNMKNKYREVLILKYLEDKSYEEISDILKKPVGTVGTLINRAKKQFKQEFKK